MKRLIPLLSLCLLLIMIPSVSAVYEKDVLGSSTQISDVTFPPVTSGPGYILPDSVLYPLDKMYQKFRIALVFSSQNRAKLHTQIAGERMSELRVMTSRNNRIGVDTALMELQNESIAAANALRDAHAQGEDVTQLARTTHQMLADYRDVLNQVKSQVPESSYEQKFATAADILWDAKLVTEDALPEGDREIEIAANVEEEVEEAVMGLATSTERLEKRLTVYQKYASQAAERELKKKQAEAERELAKEQSKLVKSQREKAIKDYLAKVQALRKQREQELVQLKNTIKELNEQLRQIRSGNTGTTSATPVTR